MPGEFPDEEANGDGVAANVFQPGTPTISVSQNGVPKEVDDVMYSDIGLTTLLNRLKQSVASARDFAAFLKKRSSIEEDQANGLKRLAKSTQDSIRRPESRQGSYVRQLEEVLRVHEKLAENGMQFALSLHQMHEDLHELSNNMERGRKHWKHEGLNAEKRASDAEGLMEKAKVKYDSLADDYDRARTGDVKGSRRMGLKGPKSAAQYEEDLLRKLQAADQDYQTKVQLAKAQREELINTSRPQAVKALQELIAECDSGLTLQLQKFAAFNEKLLLGNGLVISPINQDPDSLPSAQRSLRDVVYDIDNERDLHSFITSHVSKIPPRHPDIRYEQHPTLMPKQQTPALAPAARQQTPPPQTAASFAAPQPQQQYGSTGSRHSYNPSTASAYQQPQPPPPQPQQNQAYSQPSPQSPSYQSTPSQPQYNTPPYPTSASSMRGYPTQQSTGVMHGNGPPAAQPPSGMDLPPPLKPVFGVGLEELFRRDGSAVPMVVYQCMLAVDQFGLDVEGIYRLSGTANHVQQIKALFDHDSSRVDFRNPAAFYHDVNSVAGLLKQFFRDLPDPLLTRERYGEFIEAARIEDEIVRRDTMHAIVNSLPDAHYATLRALVLHLDRVQQHAATNLLTTDASAPHATDLNQPENPKRRTLKNKLRLLPPPPQAEPEYKIENHVDFTQVPLGLAGPLAISGDNQHGTFYAPLATAEATLVVSCSRGCKAFQRSCGIRAVALKERMSRAPVFRFGNTSDAVNSSKLVPSHETFFRTEAEKTTRFGGLTRITPRIIGPNVHVKMEYTCGDAAGQNMVTIASQRACNALLATRGEGLRIRGCDVDGQLSSDKKLSAQNTVETRGVQVIAWGTLSDDACRHVLGFSTERIYHTILGAQDGTIRAGIAGSNINTANVFAAMFIACGQDAASVLEAGWTQLTAGFDTEARELTLSLFVPSLPVGTVGGGTVYPSRAQALELLGCKGEGKKWALAESVAAFALKLDLSTIAVVANDTFAGSHERLARGRSKL